MKITPVHGEGPAPSFVITAETNDEKVILSMFTRFPYYAKHKWDLDIMNDVFEDGHLKSFCFGYRKDESDECLTQKNPLEGTES